MNLMKISQHGQLIYFNQNADSISVYENKHYRWLQFDQVFQSMMLTRKPEKLMLPHQYTLMLPLLFFRPTNVCEFGLGGGNISRFVQSLHQDIHFVSIEKNEQVIDCFQQFFNPLSSPIKVIHSDAENALFDKQLRKADWYIYDIYQHNNEATNAQLLKSKLLAKAIDEKTWLSLNLPDPTEPELAYLIKELLPVFTEHKMVAFKVPRYLNIVIHFVPKELYKSQQLMPSATSYLSQFQLRRGFNYWQTHSIKT